MYLHNLKQGFPGGAVLKNLPANAGDTGDVSSIPGLGRPPGVENGNSVFLAGKSYGQRSLAGYSPWDLRESGTTEQLTLLLVLVISSILIQTSMIIYK